MAFLMVVAEVVPIVVVVLDAEVLGTILVDGLLSFALHSSTIHSLEQWSPYISHMLCSTTHATIRLGTFARLESILFSKHRHLPFNLPKAFSTTILALLCL